MTKPKPKPILKPKAKIFCEMCGDLLDDLSQYGFCFECFDDVLADVGTDDLEHDDFVPTNAPLSSLTYNRWLTNNRSTK